MTTGPQTIVDSVHIAQGIWENEASSLSVSESSPLLARSGHGNLYLVLETVGGFPDHESIQRSIVELVQENYQTPRSITAAIREAIKTANVWLFEQNVSSPREERGIAGLTVLVLKDQDAYVGQIGPSLLYHVRQGNVTRYPDESSWLTSSQLQDVDVRESPPLGLRREIEPQLSHLRLSEGDHFVLSSTTLVTYAKADDISDALTRTGANNVREGIESLANGRDLSSVVIEIGSGQSRAADRGAAPRPRAWDRISGSLRQRVATSDPDELADDEELHDETELDEQLPSLNWRDALSSVGRSFGRLVRGFRNAFQHVLPEKEQRTSHKPTVVRSKASGSTGPDRRLLWLALGIPLVVVGVYVVTRYQYEQSRLQQFQQLLRSAQEARVAAESETNVAEQRVKIRQAISLYQEALNLKATDATAKAEQQALQERLDVINQVKYLGWNELRDYGVSEDPRCHPSTVVVQGADVFVFDPGTERVYRSLFNQSRTALQNVASEQPLLRRGDHQGEFVATDFLDITWAEAGGSRGRSNLLIVNKTGQVLEYDPWVGLKVLPTSATTRWSQPISVASYNGNLYVLDTAANRLLRYEPTPSGYDSPPGDYFASGVTVTLAGAVDMAIDGNLYLLYSSGTVAKYLRGQSVPFSQANMDEPLLSPTSVHATGTLDQTGFLYVADAGNHRIVQFNKSGEFVQQFRSRTSGLLADLRGLYVDDNLGKMYVISGCKLYWASIIE